MLESYTRGAGIGGDIGSIIAATHYTGSFTNGTFYYHNNHRGDVTCIRSGTVTVATYDYKAYGETRSSTGSYTNRFMFSSKEYDRSVSLYYYGFRFYRPETGTWLSNDPIGISGGLNQYEFCGDNPVNYIDPLGLEVNMYEHGITLGHMHRNLRLYPDNPKRFADAYGSDILLTDLIDGRQYIALGAGRVNGMLQSDRNRPRDRATYPNRLIGRIDPPQECESNDDFIDDLIQTDLNYRDNLDYDMAPDMLPGEGYNSNSYLHGLLNAVRGKHSERSRTATGWMMPVPTSEFQKR
jgi:RHS repeat-associated protein